MLSGKLARSSIILILLGTSLPARNPSPYITGNAERTGPYKQSTASSGGMGLLWYFRKKQSGRLHLLLENRRRPLSLDLQYGPLKVQAGSRFRPGPFTGFFIKASGISYLPGIPDRSYRSMGFLYLSANPNSWGGAGSGSSLPGKQGPPDHGLRSPSDRPGEKAKESPGTATTARRAMADGKHNQSPVGEKGKTDGPFLGLGGLRGQRGPGVPGLALEWPGSMGLFYLPERGMGFLSWNLQNKSVRPAVESAGSVYSDDRGTAGFGNLALRFKTMPALVRLEGTRYASRDIDPETREAYPGRKGKSGMGNVSIFFPWMELSAAGEDRGKTQYRVVRIRLASPSWKGARILLHGSRTRKRVYGSSGKYTFRKNAGLGLLLGSLLPKPNPRSLEHHFRALLLICPYRTTRGTSLAGQIHLSYTRGPYWLEAGYLLARNDSFSVFDGNSRMDPSLTIYPAAEQIFRIRAGARNVYFSLLYMERLSRELQRQKHRPSQFFSFRLQGRWKLKP